LSDVSQGVGWWQASDGRWYPPKESDEAPAPGWWLAADGRWYPPVESEAPPEPGWWLAADGRWYPPETTPGSSDYRPRRSADDDQGPAEVGASAVAGSDDEPEGGPDAIAAGADGAGPDPRRPMSVADRPPRTIEEASTRSAPRRPRPTDASQQIRRRDDASREDAIAQASARFMAASRALKFLEADIEDHREHPGMSAARSTARVAQAEAAGTETEASPSVWSVDGSPGTTDGVELDEPPVERVDEPVEAAGKAGEQADQKAGPTDERSERIDQPSDEPAGTIEELTEELTEEPAEVALAEQAPLEEAPSPPPAAPPQPPKNPKRALPEGLLIELRTSPLGADIDHIGDRLLVFDDRVELRDRNDRVRQTLSGEDITDVVVQRKFTGAVLAVESGSGESIVTRGLKPEQADQARLLIHKQTRAGRPVTPRSDEKPRSPQRPNPSVNGPKPPDVKAPSPDAVAAAAARLAILNRDRLNEADLLRKLADLHRAGVLTDVEFEEKISLVGRLVSGETLVVS
jgi:hypothetical protein